MGIQTDVTQSLTDVFALLPIGAVLWVFLGVVFIVYGIHSAIMLWHWKEYSTGKYTTVTNMFMYLGVSGGFLFLMFLAASWYSLV